MLSKFYKSLFLALFCTFALALGDSAFAQNAAPPPTKSASEAAPFSMDNYVLGPTDKIKISVYGEEGLTGEYVISSDGKVSLPLVGNVSAAGKTVKQFQDQLIAAYLEGHYLRDPKITAEVVSARPFYILGEVKIPGQYPCLNGMTVMNAVATAGGFTYRAAQDEVYIRHSGSETEEKQKLNNSTPVLPGDTIRFAERWF
jgi:protein involved in polysaccharide export with SLBB domain